VKDEQYKNRLPLPGCRQLQARQHLRGAGAITEEQKAIVLDSLDDGESRRYRMRIWHDTSYLTDRDKLMIDRDLARDGYHSLRFSFVYTPEEREQNRQMSMMSNSMHQERWHQICVQDAVRRSDAMHQVMEEISKQFVCYQYDKGQRLRYDDLSWDLFFWCNDFSSTFRGSGLPDRDYSYFTLNFNRQHDLDKQDEIRCKVLELLKSKYADWPNLDIANQHRAIPDEPKIQAAVKAALPIVLNYPCQYGNMVGKVVQTTEGYFFKKKYARKYGYRLDDLDLLEIYWNMPKVESVLEVCHA
jgi:hypothetical protein